jgi:nicotinamidase-related amidase
MERHLSLARAEDSLLVVVDPQEKLVNMIHNREEVVKTVSLLLRFSSIFKIPVVLTEHYPYYQPIIKRIFSCFGVSEFREALEASGRKRLLVTGIETHICICQTALDAIQHGYMVQVVADGVGTRFPRDHQTAIARMRQAGAVITTWEALMYEITERADTEEFKRVLELVK